MGAASRTARSLRKPSASGSPSQAVSARCQAAGESTTSPGWARPLAGATWISGAPAHRSSPPASAPPRAGMRTLAGADRGLRGARDVPGHRAVVEPRLDGKAALGDPPNREGQALGRGLCWPDGQERVAGELDDVAAVVGDDLDQPAEVRVE